MILTEVLHYRDAGTCCFCCCTHNELREWIENPCFLNKNCNLLSVRRREKRIPLRTFNYTKRCFLLPIDTSLNRYLLKDRRILSFEDFFFFFKRLDLEVPFRGPKASDCSGCSGSLDLWNSSFYSEGLFTSLDCLPHRALLLDLRNRSASVKPF